jgi:hypothetical protein
MIDGRKSGTPETVRSIPIAIHASKDVLKIKPAKTSSGGEYTEVALCCWGYSVSGLMRDHYARDFEGRKITSTVDANRRLQCRRRIVA